MRNTPRWFQAVATYTAWPNTPNAHGPFGRDRITARERRALRGIPLYINVQGREGIREAHRLGGRALSYLSFMDTYVHTAGFENGTARVPWNPQKPQILLLDPQGHFVNTPMDSTWRMWRYLVCDNTREYVEMALEMVREQMRRGADGIFVDNSGRRVPCYGHGFPVGYTRRYRGVVTGMPEWDNEGVVRRKSPEELYRLGIRPRFRMGNKTIQELPKHRHIYPNKSHDYAYERLLKKVRQLVRSYGSDKIVVVNGHTRSTSADGAMLESFIYSWAWKGPYTNWQKVKEQAAQWQPYLAQRGRLLALSYFGNTDRSPDEDGLFSFAAAALLGYLWSDYGTLKSALGAMLRTLNLGRGLTDLAPVGPVDFRFFGRGLVAINDTSRQRTVSVPACPRFAPTRLASLTDRTEVKRAGDSWRITLPAHTGRVYVVESPQP
jgi:hypothetical protein